MGMTVKELLLKMSSREIAEWMAYYLIKDKPPSHKENQDAEGMKSTLMQMVK